MPAFISPSHLVLILVAAIWGLAFVAQSAGMDHLGPHSFNAARFVLGALSLVPVWWMMGKHKLPHGKPLLLGGLFAGVVMFAGFTLQQIGLLHTSAGNAGFITSLYIVLVPIAGAFLGQRSEPKVWAGVLIALLGLYYLSIGPDLSIAYGDLLELIGALFWTAHVIIIGRLSRKVDAISLSIIQFGVAAVLASIAATAYETPSLGDFQAAWLPLLYAGVASSGIACTLQIIGQRKIEASAAALILSLEACFAALGGWWLLNEQLSNQELTGCALMLLGMMVSQWPNRRRTKLQEA